MRSGLPNYTDDRDVAQVTDTDRERVWMPQELLDIAFAYPADFEPGTNWHYTNTNYILLGMIMEELTGQTASELFEQRLFAPLGMDDTLLPELDDDGSMPPPFLHGYHYGSFDQALPADEQAQAAAGTLLPVDWTEANTSWGWTAGSVISTVDDLVIWVDALVAGTLLDPAMQQVRLDSIQGIGPDYPEAEGIYGYGYGIDRLGTYYGHGGQITGYNTAMSRDPDTGTTVIVVRHPHAGPRRHGRRPRPLQHGHQRARRRHGHRLHARGDLRRPAAGRLGLRPPKPDAPRSVPTTRLHVVSRRPDPTLVVTFHRVDGRSPHAWWEAVRTTRGRIRGGYMPIGRGRIPHDLGHLATEAHFGIRDGFWGLLARGATFDHGTDQRRTRPGRRLIRDHRVRSRPQKRSATSTTSHGLGVTRRRSRRRSTGSLVAGRPRPMAAP